MKLTTVQIDTLAALYVMQPCTTTALAAYLGNSAEYASGSLPELVRLGLAERVKAPPGPKPTAEERDGLVHYTPKIGKRPYLYRITEAGLLPAFHYHRAAECLNEGIENGNTRPNQGSPRRLTIGNL